MLYKKIPFDVKREWRQSNGIIKKYKSMNIKYLANIYALIGRLMEKDRQDYEKLGCAWKPPVWMIMAREGIEKEIAERKRRQLKAQNRKKRLKLKRQQKQKIFRQRKLEKDKKE